MGHNDHEARRPEVPPEAGADSYSGYEPNDKWLKSAAPTLRPEVMRVWFTSRYWDPANETPYSGEEGGYIYIDGGRYDASDELHERFAGLATEDEIQATIDDIESDGISEWAPIHTEPDYDSDFDFEAVAREDPHQFFKQRLQDTSALAAATIDPPLLPLHYQLLYSSLIAALEAYLADTMSYWLAADKAVFRKFVSCCEEFKDQKLNLSQIFDRVDTLDAEVEKYLQQLVWHRLDKVMPLLAGTFGIDRPPIDTLMKHILVRHDIVHRGGRTKKGMNVSITKVNLNKLRVDLVAFVDGIEAALYRRFPVDGAASESI